MAGSRLISCFRAYVVQGNNDTLRCRIGSLDSRFWGYFNAYTSFDRTVYHVTTPSSGTKIALDVLADIALNATLPDDELETELNVIRREMEMGNDDPARRSSRRLFETAYTHSPYRHTVIGYRDIFDQLDRGAIESYYRTRYAPNNCFFVVTGDVNADEVISILSEKYASHPMLPLPSVLIPPEPKQVSFVNGWRKGLLSRLIFTSLGMSQIFEMMIFPHWISSP